jgi:hypothetical protein
LNVLNSDSQTDSLDVNKLAKTLNISLLPSLNQDGHVIATWTDPGTGCVFGFEFDKQGRWANCIYPRDTDSPPSLLFPDAELQIIVIFLQKLFNIYSWLIIWLIVVCLGRYISELTFLKWDEWLVPIAAACLTSGVFNFYSHNRVGTAEFIKYDTSTLELLYLAGLLFLISLIARLLLRKTEISVSFKCEYCNYNLTGNVSGICPECGNVIVGER